MAEDKLIKSGQITWKRILFLTVCGVVIVAFVWLGGRALSIGYMLLTVAICVLLYLIAIDYGIHLDTFDKHQKPSSSPDEPLLATTATTQSPQPQRRRVNRPTKRRR